MTAIVEQILAFKTKVSRRQEAVVRYASIRCCTAIIKSSPLKTGHFVANWQWGWGSPPTGTHAGMDPSRTLAIAEMESKIAFGPRKGGVPGYFVNNLPQANRMEYGWSMQAPAGMVRINTARWASFVAEAAAEAQREIP
jgi:hypothetical protein